VRDECHRFRITEPSDAAAIDETVAVHQVIAIT
jgi:hypothetical protein